MSGGSYDIEKMKDAGYQTERLRVQAGSIRALEAGILRQAGIKPEHDVLEIGCGPGFVTDLLADLAREGRVHAVEPSPSLLSQVEGNVSRPPKKGLFLHQAYGSKLPLADAVVDFAYARFVLQHVPERQDVVAEAYRALRPGGVFCVVDSDDGLVICHPEEARVAAVLDKAQEVQAARGGDRFVGRKLQGMMHAAGFTKVSTRVLAMTSTDLPFEVLFNILLGYKASLIGDALDCRKLYEDLAADVAAGRRLVAAGVFIVTGHKA
ncbi:methyltransferase domain-containing protein [Thauera linaloolentis]|uniref:Methyltransferase type 11 domain-containing protein n=1 Tax=Thauera linaloolentis (strain DSM 12138 / JCM 21573 / CCUG 41526 / CIP 105981 / IAM 15112 / NBRC 102519 / 47Lol) TaxID=1123367 RepID=N6Z5X1_THAL4|nr:methyltransferase domain-containing protein [Thauera linaloolentis]ENO89793.1 hypothetical protein C666_04450 [Thauera linaloolentis 47Lol = DSM 12138]MCM8567018.1 methyltransferase domain-containing protein [Thauera linaloolentis]